MEHFSNIIYLILQSFVDSSEWKTIQQVSEGISNLLGQFGSAGSDKFLLTAVPPSLIL